MIHTRIDMDDAWPVMEPFAPYFVNVLLDFLDDVNAPGAVAIRRPWVDGPSPLICPIISTRRWNRLPSTAFALSIATTEANTIFGFKTR